jgi:hypothetical protein
MEVYPLAPRKFVVYNFLRASGGSQKAQTDGNSYHK